MNLAMKSRLAFSRKEIRMGGLRKGLPRLIRTALCALSLFLFSTSSAWAYFTDVVIGSLGIPFLLDHKGNVWAFKKPTTFEGLTRLPNLKNIKQIAPFIALDKDGQVFTWGLDTKTEIIDTYDIEIFAIYTPPAPLQEFKNGSLIASDGLHRFVVVQDDKDIFEVETIRDEAIINNAKTDGIVVHGSKPARKIHAREGIKSIAVTDFGTVALYRDGTVLGWPLNQVGRLKQYAEGQQISLNVPSPASSVHLNPTQTLALLENGQVVFIGGCTFDPFDNGYHSSWGIVNSVQGAVADVVAVATDGGNSMVPNFFLKRDGSVWASDVPSPSVEKRGQCGRGAAKTWKMKGMTGPAIKIATSGHVVLALAADHSLWRAGTPDSVRWPHNFVKIMGK